MVRDIKVLLNISIKLAVPNTTANTLINSDKLPDTVHFLKWLLIAINVGAQRPMKIPNLSACAGSVSPTVTQVAIEAATDAKEA